MSDDTCENQPDPSEVGCQFDLTTGKHIGDCAGSCREGEDYIRCDECKYLYVGNLTEAVQVYEIDMTTVGDYTAMKASVSRHLCTACRWAALNR